MATFGASNFFSQVESSLNGEERIHVGQSGDIHYVVIDPLFYRMSVFERDRSRTFTADVMQSITANDKVLINGQFFAEYKWDYCLSTPCDCKALGEYIAAGSLVLGKPQHVGYYNYFGREASVALWRYRIGYGNPASAQPKLFHALGAVTAVMEKYIRYGDKNISSGNVVLQKANTRVASLFADSNSTGKSAIGMHRASGLLLILSQQDGVAGISSSALLIKLQAMGIDDVIYLDGSSSSALYIKTGFVVVPTAVWKNVSMPNGLRFTYTPLTLKSFSTPAGSNATSECVITKGSTTLLTSTHVIGLVATMKPKPPPSQGLTMTISSFGHTSSLTSSSIAAELNAGLSPHIFESGTGNLNLSSKVKFTRSGGSPLQFELEVHQTPGSDFDTLKGTFSTTSPGGTALSGTVSLPIAY